MILLPSKNATPKISLSTELPRHWRGSMLRVIVEFPLHLSFPFSIASP